METDSFRPAALFMNIHIHRTNSEILIEKDLPLFQVCAIEKSSVRRQSSVVQSLDALAGPDVPDGAAEFWSGLDSTLRISGLTPTRAIIGEYAASSRKRGKSGA